MPSKSRSLNKRACSRDSTAPPDAPNGDATGPAESPMTGKRRRSNSGKTNDTVPLQNGYVEPSHTKKPRRSKEGTVNLQNGTTADEPSTARPKPKTLIRRSNAGSRFQPRDSPAPELGTLPPRLSLRDLECVRRLGQGAYGSVLLVRVRPRENPHPLDLPGSVFALKVYDKHVVKIFDKFRPLDTDTERHALHRLPWSTWVNSAIDAFHDSVNLYLLLECIPGGVLHDHIYQNGPFEANVARFYYCNIARALEFLHLNGIVHLDLKPSNILIKPDGYLCLVDLGLAKAHETHSTWGLIGTPIYMAPELRGGYDHDGYSVDWWSSGIILYEMLTQQVPFPGESEEEVHLLLRDKKYTWPPNMRIGKTLLSFVETLLAFEPRKRLGGRVPVEQHPWLAGIKMDKVDGHKYRSPWAPGGVDLTELRHFKALPEQHKMPDLRLADIPEHLKHSDWLYPPRTKEGEGNLPAGAPRDET